MLDIYDENLTRLGMKARDAVHRDGDWHRVFHCWIIYQDDDGIDYILAQYRSSEKQFFPEKLDVTAAGHYEAGETIQDGIREIKEELGIDVVFNKLISLGLRVDAARYDNLRDYEFSDVFFLINDQPLGEYKLQPDEVSGLVKFKVDDGLAMLTGNVDSISADAVGFDVPTMMITVDNFVPRVDAYLYKILVLAKRCLNGEQHLVI